MGPNYFKNLKRINNELVVLELGIWIFFSKNWEPWLYCTTGSLMILRPAVILWIWVITARGLLSLPVSNNHQKLVGSLFVWTLVLSFFFSCSLLGVFPLFIYLFIDTMARTISAMWTYCFPHNFPQLIRLKVPKVFLLLLTQKKTHTHKEVSTYLLS
jgi:hypothetical protein